MESLKNNITEFLSTSIETQLSAHPIGELISTEVIKAVKENLQGGLLGMFINDSLLQSVQVKITDGINGYLENHAKELVTPMITDELDQVMTQPISELAVHFDAYEEGIAKTLLSIYEHVIETKMDTILDKVNLKQIVEDQINNMDMLELEQLILSVMKKELNALVNLGAFIGFVLGLLNLLF